MEIHDEFAQLEHAAVIPRFYRHLLQLQPDTDAVERGYSKSEVRRAVSKARRSGLVVERRTDREALDVFYRLHTATRRRLGVPTQPKRFIRRFQGLFDKGLGFVMLVHRGPEPAAAAVFLTFNGTLTYKYGASDAELLKLRPNNLLFSDAIRWGCQNGYRLLDFGRTELDNAGLRRFKRGWGTEELSLAYTYAPGSAAGNLQGDGVGRIAKKTIQRSPPAISRLVGETLYKHYG